MSQQGPGGYGGGGYGGPPGGGAPPPGGYGPPGGGYPPGGGAPPPGGYGPPGGGCPPGGGYGPPGYGPPGGAPPGYGPPQPPYGAPPPPKKSKTALFIGLGCLAFLVLGGVGAALSVYFVKAKVEQAQSQASALASAAAPVLNNVAASPICAKAVACCQAVLGKTAPGNAAALDACKGLGLLSDAQCQKQYDGQKSAASMVGASCL